MLDFLVPPDFLVPLASVAMIAFSVYGLRKGWAFMDDLKPQPVSRVVVDRLDVPTQLVPLLRQDVVSPMPDQSTLPNAIRVQFFQEMFEGIDSDTPVPDVDQLPDLPPLGYGLRDV